MAKSPAHLFISRSLRGLQCLETSVQRLHGPRVVNRLDDVQIIGYVMHAGDQVAVNAAPCRTRYVMVTHRLGP